MKGSITFCKYPNYSKVKPFPLTVISPVNSEGCPLPPE